MKTLLLQIIDNDTTYNKSATRYLYRTQPELWQKILNATDFLPPVAKPKQRIWHVINDAWAVPKCPIEGVDLKGEMSRFQIFLKVPYPNIADPFIKAKLDESQLWYNYKTFIQIMQGIGRSIRSETDWAVTYMIDASFFDFYAKNKAMFTECFNKRVKILK
jgi:hypothetical protein